MLASVIVPTFNQYIPLSITLASFAHQVDVPGIWELILIDDGSADRTQEIAENYTAPHPYRYIRLEHRGRAAARNTGLKLAKGDVVIFCDSDRAVTSHFVNCHVARHYQEGEKSVAVIGDIWEFYFSNVETRCDELMADISNNFSGFHRFARVPVYASTVFKMFEQDGTTKYAMPWIAFFSGNVSICRNMLLDMGGFDESFNEWGFEHFELGYRLHEAGIEFVHEPRARNYHFAHRRPKEFYKKRIAQSYEQFVRLHPAEEVAMLKQFLHGEVSLQQYHNQIARKRELPLVQEHPPLIYRQLSSS